MSELLDQMKKNAEAAALADAQNNPNLPNPATVDPSSTVDEDNAAVDTILGAGLVSAATGETATKTTNAIDETIIPAKAEDLSLIHI